MSLMSWSGSFTVMPGKGSSECVCIIAFRDCILDCLLSVLRLSVWISNSEIAVLSCFTLYLLGRVRRLLLILNFFMLQYGTIYLFTNVICFSYFSNVFLKLVSFLLIRFSALKNDLLWYFYVCKAEKILVMAQLYRFNFDRFRKLLALCVFQIENNNRFQFTC